MAGFNEIQAGRFNRFLQKYFSMKGGPPAPSLSSDIQTVIPWTVFPDVWLEQGWNSYAFAASWTGLAANVQRMELRNPKGSNVYALIIAYELSSTTAADFTVLKQWQGATTDQGTSLTGETAMDSRAIIGTLGRGTTSMILSDNSGSAVVGPGGAALSYRTTSQPTSVPVNNRSGEILILGPGDAWTIENGVVAVPVNASFSWIERALEDSELKF